MKIATTKEIQALFNFEISISTASRMIRRCKLALGKSIDNILTVEEFKNYHKLK